MGLSLPLWGCVFLVSQTRGEVDVVELAVGGLCALAWPPWSSLEVFEERPGDSWDTSAGESLPEGEARPEFLPQEAAGTTERLKDFIIKLASIIELTLVFKMSFLA